MRHLYSPMIYNIYIHCYIESCSGCLHQTILTYHLEVKVCSPAAAIACYTVPVSQGSFRQPLYHLQVLWSLPINIQEVLSQPQQKRQGPWVLFYSYGPLHFISLHNCRTFTLKTAKYMLSSSSNIKSHHSNNYSSSSNICFLRK